jgi:hypothetical protein
MSRPFGRALTKSRSPRRARKHGRGWINGDRLSPKNSTGGGKTVKGWIDVVIQLTYPDYCMVTVFRLIGGARCPFSKPAY